MRAVDDVSFDALPGRMLGIGAESGCGGPGKSSFGVAGLSYFHEVLLVLRGYHVRWALQSMLDP